MVTDTEYIGLCRNCGEGVDGPAARWWQQIEKVANECTFSNQSTPWDGLITGTLYTTDAVGQTVKL